MTKDEKHMGVDKAKYEPESRTRRFGKKKDTRRWCKGKRGREHTPTTQLVSERNGWRRGACGISLWISAGQWWCRHEEICTTCGKVLRWTLGIDCPDRVAA